MTMFAQAEPTPRPSFFSRDGEAFLPSEAGRSPWNPGHQNGVAIAGLVTWLGEELAPPVPMLCARLDIDILRPTPFAPVTGEARVVRDGRKMQIVEAELIADGQVTARARLLRVRLADCPDFPETLSFPPPEEAPTRPWVKPRMSIASMVETRTLFGDFDEPGSAAIWARFHADIVPGAPADGLVQLAMLADFGNGLSSPVSRSQWTYANVDVCVHLVREPVDPWILLTSETMMQGCGVGLVNTILGDRRGAFGRAHQTLFVNPAAPRS